MEDEVYKMGLQPGGMASDGRGSLGLNRVVSDIERPTKVIRAKKGRWIAVFLQLIFGFVGGGYFYLEEKRRGIICSIGYIIGIAMVVYLELSAQHIEALILMIIGFVIYPATILDCYKVGSTIERSRRDRGINEPEKPRPPTHEERMDKVLRELDE